MVLVSAALGARVGAPPKEYLVTDATRARASFAARARPRELSEITIPATGATGDRPRQWSERVKAAWR